MKKLLIGLTLLSSMSSFAEGENCLTIKDNFSKREFCANSEVIYKYKTYKLKSFDSDGANVHLEYLAHDGLRKVRGLINLVDLASIDGCNNAGDICVEREFILKNPNNDYRARKVYVTGIGSEGHLYVNSVPRSVNSYLHPEKVLSKELIKAQGHNSSFEVGNKVSIKGDKRKNVTYSISGIDGEERVVIQSQFPNNGQHLVMDVEDLILKLD